MDYKILYDSLKDVRDIMTTSQKLLAQAKFEGIVGGTRLSILDLENEKKFERAEELKKNFDSHIRKIVETELLPEVKATILKKYNRKPWYTTIYDWLKKWWS